MGNVVFLDEAYSIAGKFDENRQQYDSFGQEALDAITDFTSEHIGLLGIVAAGYSYEMQKQFLDVNIGLPRRFPTVLTLNRYDMNSYWKILKKSLSRISPKSQVNNYHRACFEILNIIFNNSPSPNPLLKLSSNFSKLFTENIKTVNEHFELKDIHVYLKINNEMHQFMSVNKIMPEPEPKPEPENNNYLNGLTSNDVNFEPFVIFINPNSTNIDDKSKNTTISYLKSFFLYLYTGLINGDPFRSQADNITKFTETILNEKIFKGEKFDSELEKDETVNFSWIEYIYFKLYFLKNPNNVIINNIDYEFDGRNEELSTAIKENMKLFNTLQQSNDEESDSSSVYGFPSKQRRGGGMIGGGDTTLKFYISTTKSVDTKELRTKVITTYDLLLEYNNENISTRGQLVEEMKKLLDTKFNNDKDKVDSNKIYMFVILSAYVTACKEFMKPDGPFKVDGWWFYDKSHFEIIIKVLDIKKILETYNKFGINNNGNSNSTFFGGKNKNKNKKTKRFLYKNDTGKYTRYSRR
jgi:hypothetical protein